MNQKLVRIVAALLVVALTLGVGIAALAPMAGAHGDEGVLSVVSATPSGTSSTVRVKLTYESDGHPVDGATVTVVGSDDAGAKVDPVPMTAAGTAGEYVATVAFPSAGTWNLRVTSVSPSATVTLAQDITADPGVTIGSESPATSTTLESTTTVDPALGGEVEGSPTTAAPVATLGAEAKADDDGSSSTPIIVLAVGAVVLIAVAGFAVAKGRKPKADPTDTTDPTDVA